MRSKRTTRRGFTLLEVLIVGVIIILLAGLMFVAVGAAIRAARNAGETQYVRSLSLAVKQFKDDFKYYPPLVAEGTTSNDGPINPILKRVRVKGQDIANPDADPTLQGKFLRYEILADNPAVSPPVSRSSRYSLPYYLTGVLTRAYDGNDGPGFMKPEADGRFAVSGMITKPLFDTATATERLKRDPRVGSEDDDAARSYFVDRWGNPILYYRWQPIKHMVGAGVASVYPGVPANDPARKGEIRSYNIPLVLGDPNKNPALRSAEYAILSAGPDGQIDETNPDAKVNADNIVEVGP